MHGGFGGGMRGSFTGMHPGFGDRFHGGFNAFHGGFHQPNHNNLRFRNFDRPALSPSDSGYSYDDSQYYDSSNAGYQSSGSAVIAVQLTPNIYSYVPVDNPTTPVAPVIQEFATPPSMFRHVYSRSARSGRLARGLPNLHGRDGIHWRLLDSVCSRSWKLADSKSASSMPVMCRTCPVVGRMSLTGGGIHHVRKDARAGLEYPRCAKPGRVGRCPGL